MDRQHQTVFEGKYPTPRRRERKDQAEAGDDDPRAADRFLWVRRSSTLRTPLEREVSRTSSQFRNDNTRLGSQSAVAAKSALSSSGDGDGSGDDNNGDDGGVISVMVVVNISATTRLA